MENDRRRVVCLIVTRKCNLRCKYCYVLDKREESMTLDTAKRIVGEEFDRAADAFDRIEFDFIGGEPLCEFDMLKDLFEWAKSEPRPLPYLFYATTNGTLLTEDRKAWFKANRERFCLGLSYDGTKEAQDMNRSGSLSNVDIAFFRDTWPEQHFKMTIDEDTVSCLADNAIELNEKGIRFDANIACGMPAWKESSFREYARQLTRLVQYHYEHPEKPLLSLFTEFPLPALARENGMDTSRRCSAGTQQYYAVDMDGQRYACHLLSPLALTPDQLKGRDFTKILEQGPNTMSGCEGCPLDPICGMCYGMNIKQRGDPYHREENVCRTYRLQFAAVCKLAALRIRAKTRLTRADKEVSRAILKLYPLVARQPVCRENPQS